MQKNFADEKPNEDARDRLIAELRAENERLRALQGKALAGILTDSKIAKLTRRGTYRDQDNLLIQVPSEGSKKRSWVFRYTVNGERKNFGLGSYPDRSIQAARDAAQFCRQALRDGKNPRIEWTKVRQNVAIAGALTRTVEEVGREWFDEIIKPKANRYARKIENQLSRNVYPFIGKMLIESVDTNTILVTMGLKTLWKTKWPTGRDVQYLLERIFNFAIHKGYFTKANPAAKKATLQFLLPAKADVYQLKHRDSLPIDEMYPFLQKLRAIKDRSARKMGHPMVAMLLEAVAYTGVRISELIEAQQGEFDFDTMTWNVPWPHRKGGKHKQTTRPIRPIPITPTFLRVLKEAEAKRKWLGLKDGDDKLVFPSDKPGHFNKMIKTSTPSTFIRRNFPGLKLHPHGFRSTLRDWRRKRGQQFDDVLWKLQADHQLGDTTDAAYGPDLLLPERREMMLLYDKFISTPPPPKMKTPPPPKVKSGKIIAFGKQRRTA